MMYRGDRASTCSALPSLRRCRASSPTPPAQPTQGRTMGAVSSLNSLMAVVAPVHRRGAARLRLAPAAGRLAHRRAVLLLRRAAGAAMLIALRHFARERALKSLHPRTGHEPRQDPDPRLRLAGHAADRAPRARGACLLRDPPQRCQRRLHPRVRAEGHHPVGQPRQHLRGAGPARAAGGVGTRRAGARHLLRHVHDDGAARRRGRGLDAPRVRLCRGARARPHAAASRASRTSPRPKATAC